MTQEESQARQRETGYLTVAQAATLLKCSAAQVAKLIDRGRLPALNVGTGRKHRDFRIDPAALASLDYKPAVSPNQPHRRPRARRAAGKHSLRIG